MHQMNHADIGKRLQKLRVCKGEREVDISTVLEISPAHYCRLEKGKDKITVDVLQKACTYYDVAAEYILFGIKKKVGIVLEKIDGCSEEMIRSLLKIFSCLVFVGNRGTEIQNEAMYRVFMGGLLELIPVDAASAIPTVLEYEKNRRDVSENMMIKELGISRFIWTSIMHNEPIKNMEIPLTIQEQYGYSLDFLINNRIQDDLFLETQLLQKPLERQREIMHIFDGIIRMQEKNRAIEQGRYKLL